MTEAEHDLWRSVYAAVIGGLAANGYFRGDWARCRERAASEANLALYAYREAQ